MDQQFDGTSEGEWSNTLSGMYAVEETDFMAQISSNFCVTNGSAGILSFGVPSAFWPSNEPTIPNATGIDQYPYCSTDIASTHNLFSFSQGSEDYAWRDKNMVLLNGNCTIPDDFSIGDDKASSYLVDVEESESDQEKSILPSEILQHATADCTGSRPSGKNESNKGNSQKRPRPSVEIPKSKRNVKSTKSPKFSAGNSEGENEDPQGQSSNSFCSEDESNASQELNGGEISAVNLNGKTRTSRGSATDPQSLYARKRRERINERLRILQNLVPNGTKVDISTMLEEAVQYVKFLQFQIKLLSSDDLWMYAPIVYHGMNIGQDLKMITTPKQP